MNQLLYQDMTTRCNGCNRHIEVPAGKEYDFSKPLVCGLCWWEGKDTIEKENKNE